MALGDIEDPEVSPDGVVNTRFQEKIKHLNELFPHRSTSEIKSSLALCHGNFDDALDVLSGCPGSSLSQSVSSVNLSQSRIVKGGNEYDAIEDIENVRTREKVQNLLDLGILQPISILVDILGNCNWNVDQAANILLRDYMLPDRDLFEEDHRVATEGGTTGRQDAGENRPNASTLFDPTPPPTPLSLQRKYPGGVIPRIVLSLREKNPLIGTAIQESQSSKGHVQCTKPLSNSTLTNSLENNTATNKQGEEQQAQTQIYGFDNDREMIGKQNIESMARRLHELLPMSSEGRCKAMLQIYTDIDEAFDALFEEIAEHGLARGGVMTDDDDDSEVGNEEFEIERQDRNHGALATCSGSGRNGKRRAEIKVTHKAIQQEY
jgi:hypothetical protein